MDGFCPRHNFLPTVIFGGRNNLVMIQKLCLSQNMQTVSLTEAVHSTGIWLRCFLPALCSVTMDNPLVWWAQTLQFACTSNTGSSISIYLFILLSYLGGKLEERNK